MVVELLNAPVALYRPGHWFLVPFDDLLGKDLMRRRRNYWGFGSRRRRPRKTFFYKRLISLKRSTLFCDLVNQMLLEVDKVPVRMRGRRGACESLRSLLISLVMDGLLECSHLHRGLVLRDRVSSRDLGFLQLDFQRPILRVEYGELPIEQLDLSLGLLQPLSPGHQVDGVILELFLPGRLLFL